MKLKKMYTNFIRITDATGSVYTYCTCHVRGEASKPKFSVVLMDCTAMDNDFFFFYFSSELLLACVDIESFTLTPKLSLRLYIY